MKPKGSSWDFVARKIFHVVVIGLFAAAAIAWGRWPTLPIAAAVLAASIAGEWLRARSPAFESLAIRLFGPLMIPEERRPSRRVRLNGATWAMIAVVAVLVLFPMPVAIAALLVLAVGDPAAALVGSNYGRIRLGKKSLEGTIAFFFTSLVVVMAFAGLPISVAAVGCAVAALVELLPLPGYDNLWIPMAAGGAMLLMQWLM